MPPGQSKDKRLTALRKEITGLEKLIKAERDPAAKAFREQQLARAKAQLARHLQDKPDG